MADLPELRSREQILGELIDSFLSQVDDVNDLNSSAVINQFFSAISAQNFKAAASIIAMVDAQSIDRASGDALQRLAADRGVPILAGTKGSGTITITDTSFTKISSKVFVGQPAPVAGALVLYVDNAIAFDSIASKQLYIGRGTTNKEGPLTYTTVTSEGDGAYWRIDLDPTTPTTKFHKQSETVIVAQGGIRSIASGTGVSTPEGSSQVSRFSTVENVIIADGEISVTNIDIVSQETGSLGNIPRGAITEVRGLPFTASAFNENAIVNATLPDDDDAIRTRIKQYEEAKHKGTEASIRVASLNVTAPDEQKTSTSADTTRLVDGTSILVFDDSTGYEPLVSGVGFETILAKAIGGEQELQLRQFPIAIARTKTINEGPFDMTDGSQLQVTVQGEATVHTFSDSNFSVPEFATTLELAASINSNIDLNFLATTSEGRDRLVLFPKDRTKNDIQVNSLTTNDANTVLDFSATEHRTLLLYQNDILLQQDGIFATLNSKNKSEWSSSIVEGDTLRYRVDGTPEITLTLTNELFQAIDGVSTVSFFTDIAVWTAMFDRIMAGVDATQRGNVIDFSSTRGADDLSSVQITGGSLVSKIFSTTQDLFVEGQGSDYELNKNTGQIHLTNQAEFCDRFTAGSEVTRAFQVSGDIPNGPSDDGEMWWIADGDALLVASGISSGNTVTIDKAPFVLPLLSPPLNTQTIIINMEDSFTNNIGFEDVQIGDWLILRAEAADTFAGWQGHWRVKAVQQGKVIVEESANIIRPAAFSDPLPTDRLIIVRSSAPMQYVSFLGSTTLDVFAQAIRDQLEGVQVDIIGSHVRVSTRTRERTKGELLVAAMDAGGILTGFTAGNISSNIVSQHASLETSDSQVNMPSFTMSTVTDEVSASILSLPDYETIGGTRDGFLEVLPDHKEGATYIAGIGELTKKGLLSFGGTTNDDRQAFIKNFNDTTEELTLLPKEYLLEDTTRLTAGDRFYLRDNFKFDADDVLSLVIDGDEVNGVYSLPVTRLLTVNDDLLPTMIDFSADDAENSLALNDVNSFEDFDFADFKVWRKATNILTDGAFTLKVTNADFGPSGNTTMFGFVYPSSIEQTTITHLISNSPAIGVSIVLPIAAPRIPIWDGTTSFTTTVTATVGGKDTVRYDWRSGSEPEFLTAGVVGHITDGDIVIIDAFSDLLASNKGLAARVIEVGDTYFIIEQPTGTAITDSLSFTAMSNFNGIVTITTEAAHGLAINDKVGVWGTAETTAGVNPLDVTTNVTGILSDTSFTISTPEGVPSTVNVFRINGTVENLVTVTSINHGLGAGNIINIFNTGISEFNVGLTVVQEVLNDNSFTYISDLAVADFGVTGTFDFQSFDVDISYTAPDLCTFRLTDGVVSVSTSVPHDLSIGDVIEIDNVAIPWDSFGPDHLPRVETIYFTNFDFEWNPLELPIMGEFWIITGTQNPIIISDSNNLTGDISFETPNPFHEHDLIGNQRVYLPAGTLRDTSNKPIPARIYEPKSSDLTGFTIVDPDFIGGFEGISTYYEKVLGPAPDGANPFDVTTVTAADIQLVVRNGANDSVEDATGIYNTVDVTGSVASGGFKIAFYGMNEAGEAAEIVDTVTVIAAGSEVEEFDGAGALITTRTPMQYIPTAGANAQYQISFSTIPGFGTYILTWPETGESTILNWDDDATAIAAAITLDMPLLAAETFTVTGNYVEGFIIEITNATAYVNPFTVDSTSPLLSQPIIASDVMTAIDTLNPNDMEVSSSILNSFSSTSFTTSILSGDWDNSLSNHNRNYFVLEDSNGGVAVYFSDLSDGGAPDLLVADFTANVPAFNIQRVITLDLNALGADDFLSGLAAVLDADPAFTAIADLENDILTITNTEYEALDVAVDGTSFGIGLYSYNGLVLITPTGTVGQNAYVCFTEGASPTLPFCAEITNIRIDNDIISVTPSIVETHYILETNIDLVAAGVVRYDDFNIRSRSSNEVTELNDGGLLESIGLTVAVGARDSEEDDNKTTYTFGDIVEHDGIFYEYITPFLITPFVVPHDAPAISGNWKVIPANKAEGKFVVSAIDGLTKFSYVIAHGDRGDIFVNTPSTATLVKHTVSGGLARAVGAGGGLLSFGEVSTTAQEIVDYAATSMTDIGSFALEGGTSGSAIVNTSTTEVDAAANFFIGSVDKIETIAGSHKIKLTVTDSDGDRAIVAGSQITVSLGAGLHVDYSTTYDGTYTVLESKFTASYELIVQSTVSASTSAIDFLSGTFTSYTPMFMLKDGENSVLINDLSAAPMFTVKRSWNLPPDIGEQLKLIAINNDHLDRFWNKFVVSGLSNVADIETAEYGRQLQLTSQTYGAVGSIHITGGNANSKTVALVGSAQEEASTGSLTIPIGLKLGLFKNQWLKLEQTVKIHKDLEFSETTEIAVDSPTISILSGTGTFQTQRAITADEETKLRVERHGGFIAISRIVGTSLGLIAGGVQEGDWVRMTNQAAQEFNFSLTYPKLSRVLYRGFNWVNHEDVPAETIAPIPTIVWDLETSYDLGATVSYDGNAYRSADTDNLGFYPDDQNNNNWVLVWERQEWETANTGIYRVVRTYEDDTFWIENDNAVEDVFVLGDAANLAFYSYDSVMPGDTLVVAGDMLGQGTIGRYIVLDDADGVFPTADTITIEPLAVEPATTTLFLGADFNQLSIEEAAPIVLWKKIQALAGLTSSLAAITTDTPNLMNRLSDINGAFLTAQGKLGFSETPAFGVDSYKYYRGLLKEIHRTIYGDTLDSLDYPGLRGAGTNIDVDPAIVRRITMSLSINIRTGSIFSSVAEAVKAAVAGYVNTLGVGESVVLSRVISAAMGVSGVHSVAIDSPTYNSLNDTISISVLEKAFVVNPTADINVIDIGDC